METVFGHGVGFSKTKKRNKRPITYSLCLVEQLLGVGFTILLKHREKMAISFNMTVSKQKHWIATSHELHLLGQLKLSWIVLNVPQKIGNKKLSLSQTNQNCSMRQRNLIEKLYEAHLTFSWMKKKRNFAVITFFLSFWLCSKWFLLNSCNKGQEKNLLATSNRPLHCNRA